MPNAWVEHIKKYAKENNLSYSCAMTMPDCKNSYKKTKESKTKESKTKESKTKESKIKETKPHTM
jgi:RNA polymerase primary sigma factor